MLSCAFSCTTHSPRLKYFSSILKWGGKRRNRVTWKHFTPTCLRLCNSSRLTSEKDATDASRNMQKNCWRTVVLSAGLQQLLLRPASRTSLQARHSNRLFISYFIIFLFLFKYCLSALRQCSCTSALQEKLARCECSFSHVISFPECFALDAPAKAEPASASIR